jgi:hypothetical protein
VVFRDALKSGGLITLRSTAWGIIMAWSLAAAALLVVGAIAVAHDGDCRLALRNAPIESVVVPPGWAWRELDLAADGWKGAIRRSSSLRRRVS